MILDISEEAILLLSLQPFYIWVCVFFEGILFGVALLGDQVPFRRPIWHIYSSRERGVAPWLMLHRCCAQNGWAHKNCEALIHPACQDFRPYASRHVFPETSNRPASVFTCCSWSCLRRSEAHSPDILTSLQAWKWTGSLSYKGSVRVYSPQGSHLISDQVASLQESGL